MLREWTQSAGILAMLLLGAPVIGADQSSHSGAATYQWFGEFVSVDATASTITVKSPVAYQEAVSEMKEFKPGEMVWVVWSGVQDYSVAVRQIQRVPAGKSISENLVLPAELVSTDAPNQYVTLRVKVPESSLALLKAVKAGEWVTVISRHRPSTDAEAVVTVRPYGAVTD